jgi:hypothetical protein
VAKGDTVKLMHVLLISDSKLEAQEPKAVIIAQRSHFQIHN